MASRESSVSAAVLGEAAQWLTHLRSGEATAADRRRFETWRTRSEEHAEAWRRAEAILATFQEVPSAIGQPTLAHVRKTARRRFVGALCLAAIAGPSAWMAWRQDAWPSWSADLRTATGAQRTVELQDGSRLVLNTATAVDVAFSGEERRLRLRRGELLVTTAKDVSVPARPFYVETVHGRMQALGTRFSVRLLDAATRLAVFEGAVEVRTREAAEPLIVKAGEGLEFRGTAHGTPRPVDASAALWAQGMLVAKDLPLGDLLEELGRYYQGFLRCDPAVAALPVSGAFKLADTRASLELLRKTLPLRIRAITPYWISVQPL